MKRSIILWILTGTAIVAVPAFPAEDISGWTYEDLVSAYSARENAAPEADRLAKELVGEAHDAGEASLWRSVIDNAVPAREKAANGLALIAKIFPGGDPGQWDTVSGFWIPEMIPRPLAALDSVYYTSLALLEMDDAGAPWLARRLLQGLRKSSRATHMALRTAPAEYEQIVSLMRKRTSPAPVGGWPSGAIKGTLPFARPVRWVVTEDCAMLRKMVFLNSAGQPVSGTGSYAWDREKGALYRVVEHEDDDIWWWLRP